MSEPLKLELRPLWVTHRCWEPNSSLLQDLTTEPSLEPQHYNFNLPFLIMFFTDHFIMFYFAFIQLFFLTCICKPFSTSFTPDCLLTKYVFITSYKCQSFVECMPYIYLLLSWVCLSTLSLTSRDHVFSCFCRDSLLLAGSFDVSLGLT